MNVSIRGNLHPAYTPQAAPATSKKSIHINIQLDPADLRDGNEAPAPARRSSGSQSPEKTLSELFADLLKALLQGSGDSGSKQGSGGNTLSNFLNNLLNKVGLGNDDSIGGDDSQEAGGGGGGGQGGGASAGAPPAYTPSDRPAGTGASTPSGYEQYAPKPQSSGGFTGGKEGLGISDTSANGDGSGLTSSKSSWYYDWSANASNKVKDPNAQFIPMIWGQGNMNDQDLAAAKNSKSSMLFTFNEPDLPGQSNMTPQQALNNWDRLEATGKKLASPAISNGPDGIKWLDQFMQGAQASGKRVDSISLHWYGSSSSSTQQNLAALKDHIEQVHKKYPNLPINLTEFGVDPNGNSARQDPEFLKQAEQMLNGMDYVQMYAPYGLGTPNGN
jgi:hypothetical protein